MNKYVRSQEYGLGGLPETPSFLPEDLGTTDLLDITVLGNSYKRYLNPVTGEIYGGQEYWEQMALEYTEREIDRVIEQAITRFEMDHLRKTVTTLLDKGSK